MTTAKKFALCIGINDYPGTNSDLHGCVNDARDWSASLRRRGFVCTELLDARATGAAIRDALSELVEQARSGDIVVVTYSGHGSFVPDVDGDEPDGTDECWCPHDIATRGPITDDELHRIHRRRRAGVRWIVLSDSCHSGTVARFAPITTPATLNVSRSTAGAAPQRLVRFLPPAAYLPERQLRGFGDRTKHSRVASRPGRKGPLLISGCQDSEFSYDAWFNGRPQGAFTFVALRELTALEATATYGDWFDRIRHTLPSQQYPQSPNFVVDEPAAADWRIFCTEHEERAASVSVPTTCTPVAGTPSKKAAERGRDQAERVLERRDEAVRKSRERLAEERGLASRAAVEKVPLVAEGDSWFDYPLNDVLGCLEDRHGYEIHDVARRGDRIEDMAYSDGQLECFVRLLERLLDNDIEPKAVLLSGGGNDIAGDEFAQLLNHAESGRAPLNESVVSGIVDERLSDSYVRIISAVTAVCVKKLGTQLPIIVHGYGHAVPDGRGFLGGWSFLPGPWLQPSLRRKGFQDMAQSKQIVKSLIDRFNTMQLEMIRNNNFTHVHHVDVRDELNAPDHTDLWANELHPTRKGFQRVAKRFAEALAKAGVR